jgi:diguanylate cyclase (GGDEF)-like protein
MSRATPSVAAEVNRSEMSELQSGPESQRLRELYRQDAQATRRLDSKPGLWIAVIVYLTFSLSDMILIPDVAPYTIFARFVVGVTALLVLEMQLRRGVQTDWIDITCAAAIVFGYVGWLVPTLYSVDKEAVAYYLIFGTIFMMSANLFFTFSFKISFITSTIILSILYYANFHVEAPIIYKWTFGIFFISCFVFTSYVNFKLNKERYKVFLNALAAKNEHRAATERGIELLRLSRTDPLTGLANRRAVDEKLWDFWNDWQQKGQRFAVLLIDVDFFKKFNDYYGHQEGDRCLIVIAEALNEAVGNHDALIGRYSGEEFIVLARMETDSDVIAFSELLRRTVEELAMMHQHRRDGVSITTVSVGASVARTRTDTKLERIIHEADRALYLAKANGRNCTYLFDPNDPHGGDESENIAALLRIAIDQNLVFHGLPARSKTSSPERSRRSRP